MFDASNFAPLAKDKCDKHIRCEGCKFADGEWHDNADGICGVCETAKFKKNNSTTEK